MKARVGPIVTILAAAFCSLPPAARAQLNLNPLAGYYSNIPRAVRANDVGRVRSLLSDGNSPNQTDEDGATTGMHIAAANGNLQLMAILYKAGGDINERDPVGNTPLDQAADHGQVEAVRLLIELKARVNEQNKNGMTALMFAARTGDPELVRILLAGGANPNILDYTGRDAAGWALESHRQSLVQMLKDAENRKR